MPIFTYVSYTQLNDNSNGTKCNATYVGVRSTQVYTDTEVYYLNVLNFNSQDPSIIDPVGFDSLSLFDIVPWWPVSTSATAYHIMNPDEKVIPPTFNTTNNAGYTEYISE